MVAVLAPGMMELPPVAVEAAVTETAHHERLQQSCRVVMMLKHVREMEACTGDNSNVVLLGVDQSLDGNSVHMVVVGKADDELD